MLEPIGNLPDGVVGFEAKGKIQASDYTDVLLPAVGWMTPGEMKRFSVADRDEAIAWAAA